MEIGAKLVTKSLGRQSRRAGEGRMALLTHIFGSVGALGYVEAKFGWRLLEVSGKVVSWFRK